jgi:hypothetical protein
MSHKQGKAYLLSVGHKDTGEKLAASKNYVVFEHELDRGAQALGQQWVADPLWCMTRSEFGSQFPPG